ncbi:S8 family serine peptidase [Rheinheimera baltica]|uniref:S8 family serine peptidase n=1 Tax=Rheinheimera baltica TaxID=67576 RepID=A0ABT9I3H7_9GAMM|nr:S8 family serine peptidase [Rheinheimera baltica]MDP5137936.1 S8 family serine peptidase [Rheinheimera baltica]MDP5149448.1 S8 family serine peptidase [Rheinheimera baltica]MDP5188835.1 S8 family serine peptidase [Rheinheimera baltica]
MRKPQFTLTKLALLCLPATLLVATHTNAQITVDEASQYLSPVAAKLLPVEKNESKRYIVKYKQQQLDFAGPGAFSLNAVERRNHNLQQRKQRLELRGAKVKEVLAAQSSIAVELSAAELAELQNASDVEFVEEDYKRFPMAQQIPFGYTMVQANQVSDQFASNQKVCIIDSGLDLPHEDFLTGNITGTNNSGTGNWYDNGGPHGTHVAGTIAALNNSTGMLGVLPNGNLKLHIVKVFNAEGWGYTSTLANAVNTCVTNGATVINMSLGGGGASTTEGNAMQAAFDAGVLLIAAAGNDGNTTLSYPASYDAVVSVAAIDKNKQLADFSQRNVQVELAGPGVDIRSTYPEGTGLEALLSVGSTSYESSPMTNSSDGSATAALASCGLGETTCTTVSNKICLIERGNVSFVQKVQSCEDGGGLAAIIYNNTTGDFGGTLGDNPGTTIPALAVTQAVGQALMGKLNQTANVSSGASNYGLMSGTSMASPHVAGVAALLWSHYPQCTNAQIRNVLALTAEDLGTAGRDNSYGFGLVRTKTAFDYIAQNGCDGNGNGGGEEPQPPTGNELQKGVAQTSLSGAAGSNTFYTFVVPAGATNLTFTMSGGSGDADIFVKFGSAPTSSSYDCRPYKGGNAESCSFAAPQAGTYHVMINGYSAYSGVSLVADYTAGSGSGGSTGGSSTLNNLTATKGNWLHYTVTVPAGMSSLTVNASGGSGDADLYVRRGAQPTTTTYDCRPYKNGNTESCAINNPQAAVWHISLRAYSTFSGLTLVTEYKP